MKLTRSSKLWLVILAAGVLAGILGVIEDGGSIGYLIGLAEWLLLALLVGMFIRRENRRLS